MWKLQHCLSLQQLTVTWIQLFTLTAYTVLATELSSTPSDAQYEDLLMRDAKPRTHDQYLCTAYTVEDDEAYIYKFEALANANTAHHMLLYGCHGEPYSKEPHWNCPFMCKGGSPTIMFAWAKNAPPTVLPKGVGLRIGKKTNINTIVLQVHYAQKFEDEESPDRSGIRIHTTYEKQPFVAGIFLLMSTWFSIPPKDPSFSVDMSCKFERDMTMVPFAYRTHAHSLGKVITGYKYANGNYTEIGKGNPQWPQAFYPVKEKIEVKKGDYLAARCTYDSTSMSKTVRVGATGDDEMCNFYIMFYTDGTVTNPYGQCMNDREHSITGSHFPKDVSVPLPPNPALEEKAHGHHHHGGMGGGGGADEGTKDSHDRTPPIEVISTAPPPTTGQPTTLPDIHFQHSLVFNESWPPHPIDIGQVGGVATDRDGRLYIFHRASRVWNARSFSLNNDFMLQDAPINEDVMLILDNQGQFVYKFGAGQFFMPHGVEIDHEGNAWVTDVALHQVFKIPLASYVSKEKPSEAPKPALVLGKRFQHGKDPDLFCKPSDVAVLMSGEFFVSDGYCNTRVLKFSKEGKLIKYWGQPNIEYKFPAPPGTFNLPHGVAVADDHKLVCVADRENGRIQCFDLDGKFKYIIKHQEFGPRIYGVDYCPDHGGILYAVNGPGYGGQHPFTVQGFTLDIKTGALLEMWNTPRLLKNPHDVCVDPSSQSVYVGELDPSMVWKLSRAVAHPSKSQQDTKPEKKLHVESAKPESDKTVKAPKATEAPSKEESTVEEISLADDKKKVEGSASSMTPSLIIGLLLVVPVMLILIITLVIRAHKAGHFRGRGKKVFNLQGFLGNSHKGFDPLSTEESDHELDQEDSDRDEYLAPRKIKSNP